MNRIITRFALVIVLLFITAQGCSISFRTSKQIDGGVYRSDDAGITWIQAAHAGTTRKGKPILIDNVDVQFIQFDPLAPNTVYLSTRGSGLYRSDDSGTNWVKTGLGTGTYAPFAIDPQSPTILYAASGGTIVKSSDSGATWSPIYVESKPGRSITDLAIKPNDTSIILAATNGGEILLSRGFGNTWQLFSTIGVTDSIAKMFFAPGSTSTLYILTAANGLFKSTDGGTSWVSLRQGLAQFPGATTITSVATLPGKSDTLYIATGYGLLQTTDGGTSWKAIQTLVPFGSQPIQFVAVNTVNPSILYVIVGNRLRKSEDGGNNWDAKISIPTSRLISTLTINSDNPNQLFIGTVKPRR